MPAIASALTPLCERARTNASLIASTSACERCVLLLKNQPAWWLTLSIEWSLVRRTSPALITPDATSWNCWIVMLTLERLIAMSRLLFFLFLVLPSL